MHKFIDKTLQSPNALQNIGAIDRMARIIIGITLIGVFFIFNVSPLTLWLAILPLIGILPLISGILGWCPVYALFHTKSCGMDEHNACGTLPYQLQRLFHRH
ncbi:MAG: DUF2892 domain-containing protein [Gammaproteobacteria bacterium]|nr:DUF2892 domain-containing protein [Gammaproteobacteria bacterium]